MGRRVRPEQLADVLLDEAGVKPTGQELRMTQEALEERDIGRHARDLELAERAVRLGGDGHQSVRGRGDDQLGQQRIEPRAGPVAGIAERVDADARPRRQLERRERPARRARGPVGRHRLHVDPHLHRHPTRAGHLTLAQPERGQRPPRGQLELQTDEVEPGHLLRHRVLHLQARIGLDEGEGRVLAAVGVDEEFHRGQIVEARRARERHGSLEDPLPHPHAEPGRRRDLDQLLTLALNAALALPEVGDAAGAIAGDLDLDVAGAREEPLRVHLAIAERLQRLRPAPRVGRLEIIGALHGSHPAPAPAGNGLQHDPRPGALRGQEGPRLVQAGRAGRARQYGNAGALGQCARLRLVAEDVERLWRRPDEDHALRGTATGERRALAQEPVARMDRVASGLPGHGDELLGVEVGCRPRAPQSARLIRLSRVQGRGIVLRMDGDGTQPVLGRRTRDADGDLAAIGDQQTREPRAHASPSLPPWWRPPQPAAEPLADPGARGRKTAA